jgi:hypothetical protein
MADGDDETSCCNETQTAFLYLYLVYFIMVLLLGSSIVAKPMRLLATAIHEISHAIACWLTCGQVHKIEVYSSEGGVTQYAGGMQCLIAPAGYLGEAFWAMILVIMSGGRKTATTAAGGLIAALLLSLCYSPNRVLVMLNLFYVVLLAALIYVEWKVFTPVLAYITLLFGVFVGTYAGLDIWGHLIIRSNPKSDAYAMYEESGKCCPPRCIACFWLFLAILMQFIGLYLGLILMSEECEDQGWFQCIFHSQLDLDFIEFDWWPDEWSFRD